MMNNNQEANWKILPTNEDVAQEALNIILHVSEKSIEENGTFRIVLAGGTTPRKVYELLAQQSCDWKRWQLYLGDERCLPVNDPERNSEMIRKTLIEKISIPETNIHFIPAELGSKIAAETYSDEISSELPFNLVMLGMGEDGHTASLFPGQTHIKEELAHAVHNAPKLPLERVSMSAHTLSQNLHLMILVTGENKKLAVAEWQAGNSLPVSEIKTLGVKTVLLDQAAANT